MNVFGKKNVFVTVRHVVISTKNFTLAVTLQLSPPIFAGNILVASSFHYAASCIQSRRAKPWYEWNAVEKFSEFS